VFGAVLGATVLGATVLGTGLAEGEAVQAARDPARAPAARAARLRSHLVLTARPSFVCPDGSTRSARAARAQRPGRPRWR